MAERLALRDAWGATMHPPPDPSLPPSSVPALAAEHRTPPLAQLPPEALAARLRALGEHEAADQILGEAGTLSFGVGGVFGRGWMHTSHVFGFVPPSQGEEALVPLRSASRLEPRRELVGAPLQITLEGLVAADYPGGGVHQVLVELEARHQTSAEAEPVRFSRVLRAREGSLAAVSGLLVFRGIVPGPEGLALTARTINIKNEGDDALLNLFDGKAMQVGLGLIRTAQPALLPLMSLMGGFAEQLLSRTRNVVVQDFTLGLDLGALSTGARLEEGTYVALQVPEEELDGWRWDAWAFNRETGRLVLRERPGAPLPYNGLLLGVQRMVSEGRGA